MIRIVKQLKRMFPSSYVSGEVNSYKSGELSIKVYIDTNQFTNGGKFSKECETLKELDEYLASEFSNYKQVYKK